MLDLLGKGTDRGYSMIGVGLSAGLSGSRRARTVQDPLPALDLDWATNRSLPASYGPTPTLTRASTGTFFNSQGVLTSAAVNGPRFNHLYNGTSWVSKGLLVEEQRTNLALYSEDFLNAYYGKTNLTVSANNTTSPDGTNTADKITATSTTSQQIWVNNGLNTSIPFSGTCTVSFFIKKGTANFCSVWIGRSFFNGRTIWFDLTNKSYSTNTNTGSGYSLVGYGVSDVGNGWMRCHASVSGTFGDMLCLLYPALSTSGTADSINGEYSWIWGLQIENATFPTSYIGTTSSSFVRSASVSQLSGNDFSGFWNSSEGTLVVEGDSVTNGTTPFVCIDDNTSSERIEIYGSDTDPKVLVVDGGSTQVDIDAGTISNGTAFKLAFAYKLNDFAVSLNGGAVATDTVGTLPTVDRLRIGSNQAGNYLNGHIARLRYYPTRLTNTKLQELST